MGKKDRNLLIMIIGAVILMAGLVFLCIWNYNPYYNDSVYVYSDKAPRVGNNIYGYIDVPKGFVLEGSFDSNSDNYAGGKDGTFEGVRLIDPEGKACITVSLVTPDRKKKDYVGFGFGAQALFDKKKHKMTGEYVGEKFLNILFEEPDRIDCVEQISTMEDYSSGHGCLKLINDMNGYSNTWYSKKGDTIFHNQMYYLEDPDCKNKIHCVCFTYTTDSLEYRDYINTFSMTKESTSEGQMNYADSGIREGDVNIGYINLPKGYKKVEQTPFCKAVSAVEEAVKDDDNNPDYVYLVGAESASDMEQMEKYLQSFSTSK